MKIIRRLEKPTPGLVTYLDCVGGDTDWDEFRSHGSGASLFHPLGERILAEDPPAWI